MPDDPQPTDLEAVLADMVGGYRRIQEVGPSSAFAARAYRAACVALGEDHEWDAAGRPTGEPTEADPPVTELRRLLAEATPGSWELTVRERSFEEPSGERYAHIEWTLHEPGADSERDWVLAGMDDSHEFDQVRADVKLIAAARNAMPALLDEIDRLRALVGGRSAAPLDRLAALAALEPNWDSYGAPAIFTEALDRCRQIQFVPCSDGGVQIELHSVAVSAEITIDAGGEITSVSGGPTEASFPERSAAPTRDEVREALLAACDVWVPTAGNAWSGAVSVPRATDTIVDLLSRSTAEPPALALTEADAHNLGRVMTVCEGCRKGHYTLGNSVTNYPCTTPGCGCWFCNTPIVTPAQAHAAGGVAAEPNERDSDGR